MPNPQRSYRGKASWISRGCMVGVTIVFTYLLSYHYHHQTRPGGSHLNDFPTFYLAAMNAVQHRDIYAAGTSPEMMYVYPPLIAFVFTPLTRVSMEHAGEIFLLLNTLMLAGSIMLAARTILGRLNADLRSSFWPVVLLGSLLSITQMRTELTMGETDALMLFLFALAFHWFDSRPRLCGLTLGFAFNIKYLSIVAIPYLLFRRRTRTLAWQAIGSVLFALLPSLLLGWHENLRCLRVAFGGLLRWVGMPPTTTHCIAIHDIADGLSVSATSALARLLKPYGVLDRGTMIVAAGLGLLLLGGIALLYRKQELPLLNWPGEFAQQRQPYSGLIALEWPALVMLALIFSPDTNTRHLVLETLVNTLAAALLLLARPRVNRIPALIGTVIIAVSYIMPFGREVKAIGRFYYRCSVPGLGLMAGVLLLLYTGLCFIARSREAPSDRLEFRKSVRDRLHAEPV